MAHSAALYSSVEFYSRPRRQERPVLRPVRNPRRTSPSAPWLKYLRRGIKLAHSAFPKVRQFVMNGLEVMVFGTSMAAAMSCLWLLAG